MDSLVRLAIPAIGYGLRYEYGIFSQEIQNGYQIEYPDHWLKYPDPWEVAQPRQISAGCIPLFLQARKRSAPRGPSRAYPSAWIALRPSIVRYRGRNINTLRLWAATSPEFFDFGEFSSGDFVGAIVDRVFAATVTGSYILTIPAYEVRRCASFRSTPILLGCAGYFPLPTIRLSVPVSAKPNRPQRSASQNGSSRRSDR
jgi:hypothetical protein